MGRLIAKAIKDKQDVQIHLPDYLNPTNSIKVEKWKGEYNMNFKK